MFLNMVKQNANVEFLHNQNGSRSSETAEEYAVESENMKQRQHAEDHITMMNVVIRIFSINLLRHTGNQDLVSYHNTLENPVVPDEYSKATTSSGLM